MIDPQTANFSEKDPFLMKKYSQSSHIYICSYIYVESSDLEIVFLKLYVLICIFKVVHIYLRTPVCAGHDILESFQTSEE